MNACALSHKPMRLPRESLTWAELCRSPLHDFPVRDEVLYQYLDWAPDLNLLEIGPGSGFTAFWLARQVRHMTLLDAAAQTVEDLHMQLGHIPNLDFVAADAAEPELPGLLNKEFDGVFGLDVFDLIPKPDQTIRNLAKCLRPGGQLLLSFPNVAPPLANGVTCFRRVEELETLLQAAGFSRWEIFNISLRPYAASIYKFFHESPLKLFRKLRRGEKRNDRPQIYEATWAFRHRDGMNRFKPLLHSYWSIMGWALHMRGPIFVPDLDRDTILNGQLVVRAWR